jgi:hypothetical protein
MTPRRLHACGVSERGTGGTSPPQASLGLIRPVAGLGGVGLSRFREPGCLWLKAQARRVDCRP